MALHLGRTLNRQDRRFSPALLLVGLLGLWIIVAEYTKIPEYKLPSPTGVLKEAWWLIKSGALWENAWVSVSVLLYSAALGAFLAIPLGIGIAVNKYLARFFHPLVTFFQSIAGVAWVPLAIIWFGFGQVTVVFVVANSVFFIVLFNTMTGVMTIPRSLIHAVRTLGGTDFDVLKEIILPGALVNILAGLRFGLAFGWRALVAAEMIASNKGLGFMTLDAAQYFKSARTVIGILVIGLIWLLMDYLVLQPIEGKTVGRWGLLARQEE